MRRTKKSGSVSLVSAVREREACLVLFWLQDIGSTEKQLPELNGVAVFRGSED